MFNNLSYGNLLKMFSVIPKEGLETLECLKSSECLGLPSNYLRFRKLSKMHFDLTKKGLQGLTGLESLKDF